MPSTSRSAFLPWLLVGFGFLALAITFSARATLGLVMPLLMQEFGWSRSFISGAAAATLLVMALTAPFAGHAADRYGVRATLTGGLLLVGTGCLVVATAGSPIVFLLGFSGLAAIGFGFVATHVVSTAIARVFDARRGLATGIATSGATGGQFLIVPLIAVLLATLSWRWAFLAAGIACLTLAPLRPATPARSPSGCSGGPCRQRAQRPLDPAQTRRTRFRPISASCCASLPSTSCSGAS